MNIFKLLKKQPAPDDEDEIEGDRDLSSVNKGLKIQNRITNWVFIVSVVAIAGFLLFRYYAKMYEDHKAAATQHKDTKRTAAVSLPPLNLPEANPDVETKKVAATSTAMPPISGSVANSAPPIAQPPVKSQAELILERRLKPNLRFKLGNEHVAASGVDTPSGAGEATASESASAGAAAAGWPELVKVRQTSGFKASRAYLLPDPTLMMTKGTVVPCVIQPATDTTLPGIATCVIEEDTRGADNQVTLLDAGTRCVGEQGGGLAQGQRRVGIIWSRCETGRHVMVDLDSPAADALGRIGIPGHVDTHFWDRFGAAAALSLISDVGPYLIATRQGRGNNNTSIAFPNLTGPQEIMSEVLKSTINIPPTLHGDQGARVLIYLRNDLDFRDVYSLEATR